MLILSRRLALSIFFGAALLSLSGWPAGDTSASSSSATASASLPKVVCWDLRAEHHAAKRRPGNCGLYPSEPPPYGHYMMGVRWSKWSAREAVGEGAAYRLWAYTKVRLSAPAMRCGRRVFTRARFRYVGSSHSGIFRPSRIRLACQ